MRRANGEQDRGTQRSQRGRALVIAIAVVLGTGASGALADSPPDFPKRKAGLWEMRGVSAQASGLPPTQFCIGETTDTASSHLDRSVGERGACTLGAFRRAGTAWLAESVCRETRTTVTSRAIASGDFDLEYRIDTIVTYDPPLGGVRKEDKEAIVARRLGPCPSPLKAGDVVIPGMGTLNMVDGAFRAEPEPRPKPAKRRGNTN